MKIESIRKPGRRLVAAAVAAFGVALVPEARAEEEVVTLAGVQTSQCEIVRKTDTRVRLNGVDFRDCQLKLVGDVTFTLELVGGTTNVFTMTGEGQPDDWKAKECIKATKKSNIVFEGEGRLELLGKKRVTDGTDKKGRRKRSGVLVCNDLTVRGGDIEVTFDNEKNDTSCILLKGGYLQTGGRVKLDLHKKNCTNELHGVTFGNAGTTFALEGGEFIAEIAGTKSRAIDLKKTGMAYFRGGRVRAKFEGPEGRFVNGGALIRFEGGSYSFTTNVTGKMTAGYYPKKLKAVRADEAVEIAGGEFRADLPLEGSEVFTNDGQDGTDITVSGGRLDLRAGDDCISANRNIVVSGGRIRGVGGDDVLDANGSLTIEGGEILAFATAPGTHALDVNSGSRGGARKTLTVSGGVVVGTDGLDAIPIGTRSREVGAADFRQATYYGAGLATADWSGRRLSVGGVTNGVPFAVDVQLPEFPAGRTFNLIVSAPGRAATAPEAIRFDGNKNKQGTADR